MLLTMTPLHHESLFDDTFLHLPDSAHRGGAIFLVSTRSTNAKREFVEGEECVLSKLWSFE